MHSSQVHMNILQDRSHLGLQVKPQQSLVKKISVKKTEVTSSIFSNHGAMRLENNYKKKLKKKTHKHVEAKNMLLKLMDH